MYRIKEKEAYEKVCKAFKAHPKGATIADIVAKTSLPLATVRSLAPAVADEFSGRLQVTESGEILYSFPRGWTSKYRGFKARFGKIIGGIGKALKAGGKMLFKLWIMLMLVGYFVFFMALALLALLVATFASSSKDGPSRSLGGIIHGLFGLIIRIWFYSELLKPFESNPRPTRQAENKKPLYKSIFSFVFGDGDTEKQRSAHGLLSETEAQSIITFIQANKGIINLPEFMILTGLSPQEANETISAFCAEYGGDPEATEEGTIIYRFGDLMNTQQSAASFSRRLKLKALKAFSSNSKPMNTWISVINGANVAFSAYFLLSPLGSYLHALAFVLFSQFMSESHAAAAVTVGLGIVPLVFSALFWLIPAIRTFLVKRDNTQIKLNNFRRLAYNQIWNRPNTVKAEELVFSDPAGTPKHIEPAQEQIIKELGAYSIPDVSMEDGKAVYTFAGLEQEALVLQKYRAETTVGPLGATVFDSDEKL
ncbi:MAG: hypothetical protein LBB43_02070 [Spirochaetaceae bacterium]|jgi:hypothetical protein|nr:hypothetical protein [Spirochaetaceae bacterium]